MAAVPAWPNLNEGKWNLVASNILSGRLKRLKSNYTFWITYVATGDAAPLAAIKLKSPKIFKGSNVEPLSNSPEIDVYIWIEDSDSATDTATITNVIEVNI